MLAHAFSHDGAGYEVSFRRMDGQWFAAVSRLGDAASRALPGFADNAVRPFSEAAIRAGYIGLAEWLVRTGDFPEPEATHDLPAQPTKAPVDREKTPPCIDRPSQEQIGRELQAMYAEVVDQPVPDTLLSLLDPVALVESRPARSA
jgi:Anti-sigma factor NepR